MTESEFVNDVIDKDPGRGSYLRVRVGRVRSSAPVAGSPVYLPNPPTPAAIEEAIETLSDRVPVGVRGWIDAVPVGEGGAFAGPIEIDKRTAAPAAPASTLPAGSVAAGTDVVPLVQTIVILADHHRITNARLLDTLDALTDTSAALREENARLSATVAGLRRRPGKGAAGAAPASPPDDPDDEGGEGSVFDEVGSLVRDVIRKAAAENAPDPIEAGRAWFKGLTPEEKVKQFKRLASLAEELADDLPVTGD